MRIWSKLRHPNVLLLLGYAMEPEDRGYPSFISEWMENGSLKKFMKGNPNLDILRLVGRFLYTPEFH